MRSRLITKVGVRKIFVGTFEKYGFVKHENGIVESTALLVDIKAKGEVVTDHVWLTVTKEFEEVGTLSRGDKLMFTAKVSPYKKNRGLDIGLEHPTKIKRCV